MDGRIADLDYLAAEQFGWRDGVILVWAGMRGAVTVAAEQTLPEDTPQRSLIVLIATLVAVGTLLLQGSTLSWLASRLGLTDRDSAGDEAQRTALQPEDDPYGSAVQRVQREQFRTMRLDLISAERDELLDLRRSGSYPSAMLDAG